MRILWIGGSHPRHLHYIQAVQQAFPLAGAIVERRGAMIPQPPPGLAERDRLNFIRHFDNRARAEQRHFGDPPLPACPLLEVEAAELNTPRSADFARQVGPDLVLVFGSGLVREPLVSALPGHAVNLHLGLSPRYRGAATLFWPFYFLEPTFAGTTFHYIVAEPDAGDVVHQVLPALAPGDGIHDVACKAVVESARQIVPLLEIFARDGRWKLHRQRATGKNFLAADFKPEHLRVIYDLYDDAMVREVLEGRLESRRPTPVRQF